MFRRAALSAVLGLAVLGTLPALADQYGSSEQQKVTRACSAPADPHYSPPKGSDCKTKGKFDKKKSYQSTYSSNEVKCGSGDSLSGPTPAGLQVYGGGSQANMNGGMGVCSDGSLPAHGRVTLTGGTDGVKVVVDGDKHNTQADQATGYAIVKAGPGGGSVTCGKGYSDGGPGDSDQPADAAQANCG